MDFIPFILPSALLGMVLSVLTPGKCGAVLSILLPSIGIFCWFSYQEFFLPHPGGGASFFPIAPIVVCIPSVPAGLFGYGVMKVLMIKR
jgi:hypothetical protein